MYHDRITGDRLDTEMVDRSATQVDYSKTFIWIFTLELCDLVYDQTFMTLMPRAHNWHIPNETTTTIV